MSADPVCPAGSLDCGYVGGDDEQADWEHAYWEHKPCTECPAVPRDGDSLTHRSDCPRLQPGYAYPLATRAQAEEAARLMWRDAFGTEP